MTFRYIINDKEDILATSPAVENELKAHFQNNTEELQEYMSSKRTAARILYRVICKVMADGYIPYETELKLVLARIAYIKELKAKMTLEADCFIRAYCD